MDDKFRGRAVVEPDDLTPLQREMLEAGKFHLDGWTSRHGRAVAADLERRGLVTCVVGGGPQQYTSLNCTVTEEGKRALGRREEGRRPASLDLIGAVAIGLFLLPLFVAAAALGT